MKVVGLIKEAKKEVAEKENKAKNKKEEAKKEVAEKAEGADSTDAKVQE